MPATPVGENPLGFLAPSYTRYTQDLHHAFRATPIAMKGHTTHSPPLGFQNNAREASGRKLFSHLFGDSLSGAAEAEDTPSPKVSQISPLNKRNGPSKKEDNNQPPVIVKDPFSSLLGLVAEKPSLGSLETPDWLKQLLGITDQNSHNQIIDKLSLQAPWHKALEKDKIMSLLQTGMLARFCYQKLRPEQHPEQCELFEKTLRTAGYNLETLCVDEVLWGLIAHRKNEVLIGFRGTYYWEDMWRDLQCWPTMTNDELPDGEQTHYGMSLVFEKLWPQIQNQLTRIANQNQETHSISIAGHSLGGSFAKLTALRLQKQAQINAKMKNISIEVVCTFGAPKTLIGSGAQHYKDLGLGTKTIAISHHRDIVPQLPPSWLFPYETVGKHLYITRRGSIWLMPSLDCIQGDQDPEKTLEDAHDDDQPRRWLTDHGLESYLLILCIHANTKIPPPLPPGQCPTALDTLCVPEHMDFPDARGPN